jgi:hypothetical protein
MTLNEAIGKWVCAIPTPPFEVVYEIHGGNIAGKVIDDRGRYFRTREYHNATGAEFATSRLLLALKSKSLTKYH